MCIYIHVCGGVNCCSYVCYLFVYLLICLFAFLVFLVFFLKKGSKTRVWFFFGSSYSVFVLILIFMFIYLFFLGGEWGDKETGDRRLETGDGTYILIPNTYFIFLSV